MDNGKLYFHGSSFSPGTESSKLRRPSTERPFFVADSLDVAIDYASRAPFAYGTESASIFIIKTKDPLDKISFKFNDMRNMSILEKKLPKTVELIRDRIGKNHNETFFDISIYLSNNTEKIFENKELQKSLASGKNRTTIYRDTKNEPLPGILPEYKNVFQFKTCFNTVLVLNELGLTSFSADGIVFSNDLKKAFKKYTVRRCIKRQIYEAIHSLGFSVVQDGDTTPSRMKGNEYAIFDIDVISEGYSRSISVDDIENMVQSFRS